MSLQYFILSLCDDVDNIFPCNYQTDLPISLLILGYGAGGQVNIDMALLKPDTASIESRCAFSNAISIALTQLIPILEENEIKRVAFFLNELAIDSLIECPLRKASGGYSAYLSLISYSLYLLHNRDGRISTHFNYCPILNYISVSKWFTAESQSEIVDENVTILLKPVIQKAKETSDSTLLEGIINLCCRWKIKQALTNASIVFQTIATPERKEMILKEISSIFKKDDQFMNAISTCYDS